MAACEYLISPQIYRFFAAGNNRKQKRSNKKAESLAKQLRSEF